jgi:hypothetical protein
MYRHLGDLERLCNKLERRFGGSDSLYLQVKTELETHKTIGTYEPMQQDWSKSYRAFIKSWGVPDLPRSRH